MKEELNDLPNGVKALILKFALSDINVRRLYHSMVIAQEESATLVDLSNYFYVGMHPVPPFGMTTEIILPWEDKKPHNLLLSITLNNYHMPFNPYAYASISVAGFIYE